MTKQDPGPAPMLFAFRGVRGFQITLAFIALACGIGATLVLKSVADGGSKFMVLPAGFLGIVFLWSFAATLRVPTSYVAITAERTRIRFAGFVDTVISNDDIAGARLKGRSLLGGIGVRTNFGGDVALVTTWGQAAELELRRPVRIWLLPKVIPLNAHRLALSVRNPQKMVERFGAPTAAAPSRNAGKSKQRGSRTR